MQPVKNSFATDPFLDCVFSYYFVSFVFNGQVKNVQQVTRWHLSNGPDGNKTQATAR